MHTAMLVQRRIGFKQASRPHQVLKQSAQFIAWEVCVGDLGATMVTGILRSVFSATVAFLYAAT